MSRISVEGGSRLHAGFHIVDPQRRVWGGAGFYIDEPRVRVEAWDCGEPRWEVDEDVSRLLERAGFMWGCLRVLSGPPRHVGLGSTTQLSLAAALALSALKGLNPDIASLALKLGRGRFSAVGTLLAAHGGFVLDSGEVSARPVAHLSIPGDWRFVVVLPRVEPGLEEGGMEDSILEAAALRAAKGGDLRVRGALLLAIGIARRDLDTALEGLSSIQAGTGLMFQRFQGGVYRRDLLEIIDEASRNGVKLAQSSWGPTLYTISHESTAPSDARMLKAILRSRGIEGEVLVAKPRNVGLKLEAG